MAKLKIMNLKQVQTALRKKITKQLRSPEVRKGVAEIIVSDIKDSNLGTPAKFTKEMREYLEPYNTTDPKYRRGKISANFTGELLQDLINNVKAKFGSGKSSFVIEHSNKSHKPYKQPSDGNGKGVQVTSLKSRKTRDTRDRFSKNTFTNTSAKGRKTTRAVKVPYKFISTQLIKRLGYDYLKFSSETESKVIKFIRDKIFKNLK
jgi:hypothetical protein